MKTPFLPTTIATLAVVLVAFVAASPFVVPIVHALTLGADVSDALLGGYDVALSTIDDYPAHLAAAFVPPYLATTMLCLLALAILVVVFSVAGRVRLAWERRTEIGTPLEDSKVYSGLGLIPHVRTWSGKGKPKRGGICLGTIAGRQAVFKAVHACVIAKSGGGKTRACAIPTIYLNAQRGSNFVITDRKGELYAFMKPYLESQGYEVYCLDFKDGARGDSVDFLDVIKAPFEDGDIGTAQKRAETLGALLSPATDGENAIFSQVAAQIISAIAFNICADPTIPDVMRNMGSVADTAISLTSSDPEDLKDWIRSYGDDSLGVRLCPSFLGAEGKELSAFVVNMHEALSVFNTEGMRYLTQADGSLKISDIPGSNGKPKAVFLRTVDQEQTGNRLVALFLKMLWDETERQGTGGRELYAILDEYATVSRAADWGAASVVEVSRGYGWHLLFIVQNMDGLGSEYIANTILGNCSTVAFYGSKDDKTTKWMENHFGKRAVLLKNTGASTREEALLSENQGYTEQSVNNFSSSQLGRHDALLEGVLVSQDEPGDRRHSGLFQIKFKELSRTRIGKQLDTIGSIPFEKQVKATVESELDARAASHQGSVKTWTPKLQARTPKPAEQPKRKLNINVRQDTEKQAPTCTKKIKIFIPGKQEKPSRNADRFSL